MDIRGALKRGIGPGAVIFSFAALVNGIFYTFLTFREDVQYTFLYNFTGIGNIYFLGPLWLVSSILVILGLTLPRRGLLKIGAMGNFIAYSYAAWLYLINDLLFPMFNALTFLLIYAYFFLAAQMAEKLPRD